MNEQQLLLKQKGKWTKWFSMKVKFPIFWGVIKRQQKNCLFFLFQKNANFILRANRMLLCSSTQISTVIIVRKQSNKENKPGEETNTNVWKFERMLNAHRIWSYWLWLVILLVAWWANKQNLQIRTNIDL